MASKKIDLKAATAFKPTSVAASRTSEIDARFERATQASRQVPASNVKSEGYAIEDVKLSSLIPNPHNARSFYDLGSLDSLGESQEDDGQKLPIKVAECGDGKLMIVFGHRRVQSRTLRGMKTVRAEVLRGAAAFDALKPLSLFLESQLENTKREQQTAYDDAISYKKALDEKLFASSKDLATALKVDPSKVTRTLKYWDLPANCRATISKHAPKFAYRTIAALADLSKEFPSDADLMAEKAIDSDEPIGYRTVEAQLAKLLAARANGAKDAERAKRSISHTYALTSKDSQGEYKSFPDGRVTVKIKFNDLAKKPDFEKAFQEFLINNGASITQAGVTDPN
jgi:ParB family transcriptional regulator, chromosome partitioning protein